MSLGRQAVTEGEAETRITILTTRVEDAEDRGILAEAAPTLNGVMVLNGRADTRFPRSVRTIETVEMGPIGKEMLGVDTFLTMATRTRGVALGPVVIAERGATIRMRREEVGMELLRVTETQLAFTDQAEGGTIVVLGAPTKELGHGTVFARVASAPGGKMNETVEEFLLGQGRLGGVLATSPELEIETREPGVAVGWRKGVVTGPSRFGQSGARRLTR